MLKTLSGNGRRRGAREPTIAQCFLNADMRGSHNGLKQAAKENGVDLDKLGENQFVVFVNKKQTLMKIWAGWGTYSYTRSEKIDLSVIKYLPRVFGASSDFDYPTALRISLEKKLKINSDGGSGESYRRRIAAEDHYVS